MRPQTGAVTARQSQATCGAVAVVREGTDQPDQPDPDPPDAGGPLPEPPSPGGGLGDVLPVAAVGGAVALTVIVFLLARGVGS